MIYVKQVGRCGNQLFNYAFARKIQLEHKQKKISFNFYDVFDTAKKGELGNYWEDSISRFRIEDSIVKCTEGNDVMKFGDKSQKCAYFIWKIIDKMTNHNIKKHKKISSILFKFTSYFGIYYKLDGEYTVYNKSNKKNLFIYGSFEDSKWFDEIQYQLKNEILPVNPISEINKELFELIRNRNSVCISLRKWSLDVADDYEVKNRTVCDDRYYQTAVKYIKNKLNDPVFVIFSDDVIWAKKYLFSIDSELTLYSENGHDDVAEKLRLMSSCKHFIMSNSTFCWWAQYLSVNKDKIVLSPKSWKADEESTALIQESWVLIDD